MRRNIALSVATMLMCAFIVCPWVLGQSNADIATSSALTYYNSYPRAQAKAAALLEAASTVASDDKTKRLLLIDLARVFSQSYNHETEMPDYDRAIGYYRKSIANVGPHYSLDAIEVRIELADLLARKGEYKDAEAALLEVINVNIDDVFEDQMTPEVISKINQLDFREKIRGISLDSPVHKAIVANRMKQPFNNTKEALATLRDSATRSLAIIAYREKGIAGLKDLFLEYRNDRQIRGILTTVIADYAAEGAQRPDCSPRAKAHLLGLSS